MMGGVQRYGSEELAERLFEKLAAQLSDCFRFTLYGMQAGRGKKASVYKGARMHYAPFPAHYQFLNSIASFFYLIHAVATADLLCFSDTSRGWAFPLIRFLLKKRIVIIVPSDYASGAQGSWRAACNHWAVTHTHAIVVRTGALPDVPELRSKTNLQRIDYCAGPLCTGHASPDDSKRSERYCYCPAEDASDEDIEVVLRSFAAMPTRRLLIASDWSRSPARQLFVKQYNRVPNIRLIQSNAPGLHAELCSGAQLTLHLNHRSGEGLLRTAMHIGMPILAADNPRYRELTDNKALYFKNMEALIEVLSHCNVERLKELGQDMKAVSCLRFEEKVIVRRFYQLFDTQLPEIARQYYDNRNKKAKSTAFRGAVEMLRRKPFPKLHTS